MLRPMAQRLLAVLATVFLMVAMSPVELVAADIVYGDFMGTDVTFLDLTESSTKPLPLYGAPTNAGNLPGGFPPCTLGDNCTISGNSLHFSPQQFLAESNNFVPPIDTTDGQLTFRLESKPDKTVQNIHFSESGLFEVSGFLASNTDDTSVRVTVFGNATVLEIDGDSNIVPLPIPINLSFVFTPQSPAGPSIATNEWRFLSEGDNAGFWTGTLLLDISQELADAGYQFDQGATRVDVNIDNRFRAKSEPGGTAYIDKKLFLIVTVNVPEPASCLLAIAGLMIGVCFTRRSR
jgi:hypothetical protein